MQITLIKSATIRYTLENVTGCPIFLYAFRDTTGAPQARLRAGIYTGGRRRKYRRRERRNFYNTSLFLPIVTSHGNVHTFSRKETEKFLFDRRVDEFSCKSKGGFVECGYACQRARRRFCRRRHDGYLIDLGFHSVGNLHDAHV